MNDLVGKKILLGVSGGIACYKSAELLRLFLKSGAEVRVVMTRSATKFISPLTFNALSGNKVYTDKELFDENGAMEHINLARWADCILIAPATANIAARMASGMADDLLTSLCLATTAPIALAPAMNQQMWLNPPTQENISNLRKRGVSVLGPGEGSQACGETGLGRMLEPEEICEKLGDFFQPRILKGKRILLTAGPTREALDPIRYLTNGSSGKMGYALAEVFSKMGGEVILVSGPTSLAAPLGLKRIDVVSAEEMYKAVMEEVGNVDIFVSVAAVADYKPVSYSRHKLKKQDGAMVCEFTRTKDVLKSVSMLDERPFLVGFAAETQDLLKNAHRKLLEKCLDYIVVNKVGEGEGFGSDFNAVTIISKDMESVNVPYSKKEVIAQEVANVVAKSYLSQEKLAVAS